MTETMAPPKTLDIQLATAGAKKSVKTAPTGLHHFDFDGMRQAHGGHLKQLESISLSCLHGEHELTQSQLLVMQSAIFHLAITRTYQNCLHNMRQLPYDHLVLAMLTCNYIQYM